MFQPIPVRVFSERTGFTAQNQGKVLTDIQQVVSLRSIVEICHVMVMPLDYLVQLLQSVTLAGYPDKKVYAGCQVTLERTDPSGLKIGQSFVQRGKYQALLELFATTFANFCVTRGVAKCNALIVQGLDEGNIFSLAHYVPPIIENNGGQRVLLDGVHRNYLVKQVGTTLETVVIHGVTEPFPCALQEWSQVKVVDQKPPRNERYFNLRQDLFRVLEQVGIDG